MPIYKSNVVKFWRTATVLASTGVLAVGCGGGASDVAGGDHEMRGRRHHADPRRVRSEKRNEPGWSKIIPAFPATEEGKGVAGHDLVRCLG